MATQVGATRGRRASPVPCNRRIAPPGAGFWIFPGADYRRFAQPRARLPRHGALTQLDMIHEATLAPWLAKFADRTVLVVGDIMLDRYVLGEVRRISPEAPIPVLRATGATRVLGGAANVAQNVTQMG